MRKTDTPTYPRYRAPWDLEPYYSHHVGAMTSEELHEKADIAYQLALRDKQIAELQQELDDAFRADHPVTNAEMIRRLEAQLELHRMIETHDPLDT